MLYKRLERLCELHEDGKADLARRLALSDNKFRRWFNEKSQKNFFPYLEKILTIYPKANPEWLYRGIGEPLSANGLEGSPLSAVQEEVLRLRESLAEKDKAVAALDVELRAKEQAHAVCLARLADTALELARARGELADLLKERAGRVVKSSHPPRRKPNKTTGES